MEPKPADIIDLHVHLFPEKIFRAIWNFFETRGWPVHHEFIKDIKQTLLQHGVGMAAGLAYSHKKGVARSLNAFMASVGQEDPFFRTFATVHPDDDDFREYLKFALASPYLYGFKFQPLVQNFDVNDGRLDYLYRECQLKQIPIIMHIGSAPIVHQWVGLAHFKKLMRRFPELRICVAHMGMPETDEFLKMMDDYPSIYLDTAMINTRTRLFDNHWRGDPDALKRHRFRICFGSDWPHVPYSYKEALDSIARFPLPEESRPDLYFNNAATFLNLDQLR